MILVGKGLVQFWITERKEMLAREREKYIIGYLQARRCWHGRRRSTLLDKSRRCWHGRRRTARVECGLCGYSCVGCTVDTISPASVNFEHERGTGSQHGVGCKSDRHGTRIEPRGPRQRRRNTKARSTQIHIHTYRQAYTCSTSGIEQK